MAKTADLNDGLTVNTTTRQVTAAVTPAVDDNSLKLATTAFILNAFNASGKQYVESSGYQKFPGGLILQWGQNSVAASSTLVVTLPISFPTEHLIAVGSVGTPIAAGSWTIGCSPRSGFLQQIVLQNTDTVLHGVYWIALGK